MQPSKAEIEFKKSQILIEETEELVSKLKALDLHVKMIVYATAGD